MTLEQHASLWTVARRKAVGYLLVTGPFLALGHAVVMQLRTDEDWSVSLVRGLGFALIMGVGSAAVGLWRMRRDPERFRSRGGFLSYFGLRSADRADRR